MTIDDEEVKQSSSVRLNENVRISRHHHQQHHQQQQNEVKGGGEVSSSSSSSLFHTESFFPSALQTHHYHDAFGPGGDEGVDYGPPNPYDDDDDDDDGNDNDNDGKNETEVENNHLRSNNNLKSVTEEAISSTDQKWSDMGNIWYA